MSFLKPIQAKLPESSLNERMKIKEAASYFVESRTLLLDSGLTLAFTDTGEGFPVLFIHGLGSSISAWQKTIPALKDSFRCLAVDLPGFGRSSKSGSMPSMEFYADIINELLDKLQIKACGLAGHSMGGQVAVHTALKYPEKVRKLALLAPAGLETFTAEEALQLESWFQPEKIFQAGPDIIEQNVKLNFFRFPEDAQRLLEERLAYKNCTDYPFFCRVLSQSVKAMLQEPVFDKLSELNMPVLTLFGRNDAYIPSPVLHPFMKLEEMVLNATARIPQNEVVFVNSCGHFIQFEQPEKANSHLLSFFSERQ